MSLTLLVKTEMTGDFPGGPVFGSLPGNAEDMDLTPGRGAGIPHVMQQLGPCTTTRYINYLYAIGKHYYL